MIADYKGPLDDDIAEAFIAMRGETVSGMLRTEDDEDIVILVFSSGYGFELDLANNAFRIVPHAEMDDLWVAEQTRLQQALEALGGHK